MQWNIGISRGDIKQIIRDKKCNLSFKWLPLNGSGKSIADPFLFRSKEGELNIIYEDFSMVDLNKYGTLEMFTLSEEFNIIAAQKILDTKSHISYPFVFKENETTYIIPESRKKNKVSIFEYDFDTNSLKNEKVLIDNCPLLDSTILKYHDKYWLFATLGDNLYDHSKLYIYYADNLHGPYTAHPKNPVKFSLKSSRPAGNFIVVDGEIYRPSQNCEMHYGHSITINKIIKLDEFEYIEQPHLELSAEKGSGFNEGLHTINILDDIIVIDGIRMVFKPFLKGQLFFQKRLKSKESI
jgi:hypothetical protein